jgi:hypothetical protein
MADFGKAGKLTVRTHDVAALINLSAGEYIFYKLTVKGAEPLFTYACKDRARLSEHQFQGHPKKTYEWTWSRNQPLAAGIPNENGDAPDDLYVVSMSFIAAIKYTLLVEQRRADDSVIRKLKDIDYESQSPEDNFTETLRVFTA